MDLTTTINTIRDAHRVRKWAMKGQSKLDRSLESLIRQSQTDWRPDDDEKSRKVANEKVKALIRAARADKKGSVWKVVQTNDQARLAFDLSREDHEETMEEDAKRLPVWQWAKTVSGFGALGLAKIVAETVTPRAPFSLSSYRKGLDGVYSRLGLACYGLPEDGNQYAGSTWKRQSWRPRALTADEWIEHPFSGERYADLFVIIDSLLRKQLTSPETLIIRLPDGKEKKLKAGKDLPEGAEVISEAGERRANGPYGEVYLKRRARTAQTHPEWTDMHAHRDAQRVAMKALVADLYAAWMRLTPTEFAADVATDRAPTTRAILPSPRSAASDRKAA